MLQTKSWRVMDKSVDGVRVCIMRYMPRSVEFDIYIPALAPPEKLLMDYRNKKIEWQVYEKRFMNHISGLSAVDVLSTIALEFMTTIYCAEPKPDCCHRRLVAEECRKRFPRLEVRLL